MIFSATHTITCRYENFVYLEPQTIRLKPRTDGMQQLLNFNIDITPHPAGLTECRDLDGNMEHVAWFSGATELLTISASTKVVTFPGKPFANLLKGKVQHLPLDINEVYRPSVRPYLSDTIETDIIDFSNEIAVEANRDTVTFLELLAEQLHSKFEVLKRGERLPREPSKVLRDRSGSCNDLTWLFMTCCRSQKIGSRYINGYQESSPSGRSDLHCWAEVYLPGAGWRGYDPSMGCVVDDRHVALAAGPRADSAAPVTGAFRGEGEAVITSAIELTVTSS